MTVVLVGNKNDLEHRRTVSYEEGERFAQDHRFVFLETSAKTAENVDEMFASTARDILAKIKRGDIDMHAENTGVRLGPLATSSAAVKYK